MAGKKSAGEKGGKIAPLEDEELQAATGGMDVRIESVQTSVSSTEGGGVSPGVLQKLVGIVVDALKKGRRPS